MAAQHKQFVLFCGFSFISANHKDTNLTNVNLLSCSMYSEMKSGKSVDSVLLLHVIQITQLQADPIK